MKGIRAEGRTDKEGCGTDGEGSWAGRWREGGREGWRTRLKDGRNTMPGGLTGRPKCPSELSLSTPLSYTVVGRSVGGQSAATSRTRTSLEPLRSDPTPPTIRSM